MQIPVYEAAKEAGWNTIGVDGNNHAPFKDLADEFWHIDLKDRVGLAEKADEYHKTHGLNGVFTAGTDFSASVAWVAEKLGLPGIPYQTALNATDKIRMRQCFKRAGLKTPFFCEIGPMDKLEEISRDLEYPLVVKPVDNMGARGVRRVDNYEQLEQSVLESRSLSRSNRAIIEEYIKGPEYSIDALIYKDKIQICGIADREIILPPFFVERGHHFPSTADPEILKSIEETFIKGIRALGIDTGAAKGDIKYTSDGVVIGEIAARLSGGYMSGWTYPYASEKKPIKEAMKIAMGESPDFWGTIELNGSAERAVISIPGRIASIEKLDEVYSSDEIKEIFLLFDEGENVKFPINNVEKAANIIAVGKTREQAVEQAETAAKDLVIRLEPGNKETAAFLYDMYKWPGPAFTPVPLEITDYKIPISELTKIKNINKMVHIPRSMDHKSTDLMNRTITEIMISLSKEYDLEFIEGDLNEWDKLFWSVFFKGSIQGIRWLIDTIYLDS